MTKEYQRRSNLYKRKTTSDTNEDKDYEAWLVHAVMSIIDALPAIGYYDSVVA